MRRGLSNGPAFILNGSHSLRYHVPGVLSTPGTFFLRPRRQIIALFICLFQETGYTVNMKAINNISGTSLIGYVAVSYNRLVEVFGEPHFRGDKTTVEWAFEHDGEKFTIYNYKWASCQNDTIESFHIGGRAS